MKSYPYKSFFFIGIAGTGMSAIAQYLKGKEKKIAGSDRMFHATNKMQIQEQFESQGITCFSQDGGGITQDIDVVVISTAIEESNIEYQKAKKLHIPIIKRSELLAIISNSIPTIAVGGTAGKSTTTAMIFHILQSCGKNPSLITGAGLSSLQKQGIPGNAWVGEGNWLVIEADESDGSIVNYSPEIGILLNIQRDHKEYHELQELFTQFKENTKSFFIVNQNCERAKMLSQNAEYDFGFSSNAGIYGHDFKQNGFSISFSVHSQQCTIPVIGKHNMENALAALAVSVKVGISMPDAIHALASFEGIYRRTQLVGKDAHANIYVVDDFAHNPSEVSAAIAACQEISPRVIAWFQPHGFGPLQFMHKELAQDVSTQLRKQDIFCISDVFYAGGTVDKNISPRIVSDAMQKNGKNALYIQQKNDFLQQLPTLVQDNDIVLIMGARDPHLHEFAQQVLQTIHAR